MLRGLLLFLSLVILAVIATTGYILVRNVSTPEIQVPDVVGKTYEEAAKLLKERGLLVEIVSVFGPDTEANLVTRLMPPAGSMVKPDRRIVVQVVSGEALLELPDLVGVNFVEAENRLRRAGMAQGVAGFRLGKIASVISDSPPGLILGQTPPAGTQARAGTAVDIVIAVDRGGETMPNLIGKRLGEAIELLGARGYSFQSVEPFVTVSTPPDVIMSQTPAPGARLAPTSVIKAIVSQAAVAPAPAAPNAAAETAAPTAAPTSYAPEPNVYFPNEPAAAPARP